MPKCTQKCQQIFFQALDGQLVLDNRSDFKFLNFANVSHPSSLKSALHKQPSMTAYFHTPNVLQLDQMTD